MLNIHATVMHACECVHVCARLNQPWSATHSRPASPTPAPAHPAGKLAALEGAGPVFLMAATLRPVGFWGGMSSSAGPWVARRRIAFGPWTARGLLFLMAATLRPVGGRRRSAQGSDALIGPWVLQRPLGAGRRAHPAWSRRFAILRRRCTARPTAGRCPRASTAPTGGPHGRPHVQPDGHLHPRRRLSAQGPPVQQDGACRWVGSHGDA